MMCCSSAGCSECSRYSSSSMLWQNENVRAMLQVSSQWWYIFGGFAYGALLWTAPLQFIGENTWRWFLDCSPGPPASLKSVYLPPGKKVQRRYAAQTSIGWMGGWKWLWLRLDSLHRITVEWPFFCISAICDGNSDSSKISSSTEGCADRRPPWSRSFCGTLLCQDWLCREWKCGSRPMLGELQMCTGSATSFPGPSALLLANAW